jgi:hypothetical protein
MYFTLRLKGLSRASIYIEQPVAFVFNANLAKNQDNGRGAFSLKVAVWNLTNEQIKEHTAQAFLRVSDDGKF